MWCHMHIYYIRSNSASHLDLSVRVRSNILQLRKLKKFKANRGQMELKTLRLISVCTRKLRDISVRQDTLLMPSGKRRVPPVSGHHYDDR